MGSTPDDDWMGSDACSSLREITDTEATREKATPSEAKEEHIEEREIRILGNVV